MPDLAPAMALNRSLSGVERRFAGDLLRQYRAFRLQMLDAIDRFGLAPQFASALDGGLQQLRSYAQNRAVRYAPEIESAAQSYVNKMLRLARDVGVALSDGGFVAGQFNQVVVSELSKAPWIDMARARMVAESARLRLGDDEQAAERLLSTQPAGGRVSAWRHGRNSLLSDTILGIWAAANGVTNQVLNTIRQRDGVQFRRQAIAAIDERTTDCCLRVHGQVQPFGRPFKLVGTPRFADEIQNPPFHWYCRTATAMYLPEFEDIGPSSAEMILAAQAELAAREATGKRVEIHPAHATSRR